MALVEQRYARALNDLVERGKADADTLRKELGLLSQLLESSTQLRIALASPAVDRAQKLAVVDALGQRLGVSRLTHNFLAVSAERGRLHLLPGILQAFEQLRLAREGIVKGEIVSARVLTTEERAGIVNELARAVGGKLQADFREDNSLLGGFTARVADKVFDASVLGRLQRLRQSLMGA